MSEMVIGKILLDCGTSGSKQQYLVELYEEMSDPGAPKLYREMYGSTGNLNSKKEYGAYFIAAVEALINKRIAKGYEIAHVNGKPFTSGFTLDAIRIFDAANDWSKASTDQPEQKIKQRDVVVTFSAGQFAPIW